MVSALDEGIGKIVEALKNSGLYNDTLILFTGDNGPEVHAYGTCYPLRGGKHTLFERGTHANAFMHGWGLKKPGTVYDYMLHAVDWLPTLVGAAGGEPPTGIDGINQWDQISSGAVSRRLEMVYNLDDFDIPKNGHAALSYFKDGFSRCSQRLKYEILNQSQRWGPYKLIEGFPGSYDGWYRPMNETKDIILLKNVYKADDDYPVYLFDVENVKEKFQNKSHVQFLRISPSEHLCNMIIAIKEYITKNSQLK